MQRHLTRQTSHILTHCTTLDSQFNFSIQTRQPHVASYSNDLHATHIWVFPVQFTQQPSPQDCRHNKPNSPKGLSLVNRAAMGRARFLLCSRFILFYFFNRAAMGRTRFLLYRYFIYLFIFFVGDQTQTSTQPNRQRDFKSRN